MGNCLRREPATVWAGDDWASSPDRILCHETQSSRSRKKNKRSSSSKKEDQRNNSTTDEAEENGLFDYTSSSCGGHDVEKIKINAAAVAAPMSTTNDTNKISSSTEVKVRITKKQLEELLNKVELQGLSVEQLLEQLIHVSSSSTTDHHPQQQDSHMQHQQSWRPALSSIPEAIELNNDR